MMIRMVVLVAVIDGEVDPNDDDGIVTWVKAMKKLGI